VKEKVSLLIHDNKYLFRALTMELNVFYESNWTQLAELELQKFQEDVLLHLFPHDEAETYRREPFYNYGDDSFENFPAAILYSLTLITTIGKGSLTTTI
jgi:hypothetical protein